MFPVPLKRESMPLFSCLNAHWKQMAYTLQTSHFLQ